MNRNIAKVCPFTYGFLGFDWRPWDHSSADRLKGGEMPMDRVRAMYSIDESGTFSPELKSIPSAGFVGFLGGFLYGGATASHEEPEKSLKKQQPVTKFQSQLEANRRLKESAKIMFFRGAWKWGWRLGLFAASYTAITQTIAVYNGRSSVWEYLTAGGVTGLFYKIRSGVKGMMAGGVIGCGLGGAAGLCTLAILKYTGSSTEELRYWRYSVADQKNKIEAVGKTKLDNLEMLDEQLKMAEKVAQQRLEKVSNK